MSDVERYNLRAKEALKPLADIADEYDNDGLNQARPEWVKSGVLNFSVDVELYCGRAGKCLLTLRQCMQARFVLTGKPYSSFENEYVDKAKKIFELLYIGGITWDSLSESKRIEYIEKVKRLK